MEAVCVVLLLIIDIPTGALADIIGRKKMLVIGQIFLFVDFLFFACMSEAWHAWIANILWAIGAAFCSGADKALIQESCIALGKDKHYYRAYAGKAQGLRLLLLALCAPITTWVATYDLRLPLFMSIPFSIIPIITACMLTEPPRSDVAELTTAEHIAQMKKGLKDTVTDKRILWITLYLCVIAVVSKIWFFSYNTYFEHVGLPLASFGWVFFALNVVTWFASHYGHIIEKKLGDNIVVWILIPMIGLPIIIMSLVPIPMMAFMVIFQNVVRGMHGPFFDSMSGQYLKDSTRATVLSVQSSAMSMAGSVGLLGFGLLVRSQDILTSLLVLGISTLICHFILMKSWNRYNHRQ